MFFPIMRSLQHIIQPSSIIYWRYKNKPLNIIKYKNNMLHRNKIPPIPSSHQKIIQKQPNHKLSSIINTFRQNNMRLMQQIQQCDKVRQKQAKTNRKMVSEKIIMQKYGQQQIKTFQNSPRNHGSVERLPHSSKRAQLLLSHPKKQNLVIQQSAQKYIRHNRTENKQPSLPPPQCQIRLVKLSLDRLVPLSIDRLRERIKML